MEIYADDTILDLSRMEKIDIGLTAQNLRYPVYKYVHLTASKSPEWPATTAKFSEHLALRNLGFFPEPSGPPKGAKVEIARRLGKLHSAFNIEGLVEK